MFEIAELFRNELRKTSNEELIKLAELSNMQQYLDLSIYKEKGITEYPKKEVMVALIVELGELMNEFPTKFKYWKDTAKDNYQKGLVEYVDCLHFALSLTNYMTSEDIESYTDEKYIESITYSNITNRKYDLSDILVQIIDIEELCLPYLMMLGKKLGFSWDEIYKTYIEKNRINCERLNSGY